VTEPEAHEARKAALDARHQAARAVRQAERDLQAARDAELVAVEAVAQAERAWATAFDEDRARREQTQDQETTR
jgi:hypothetical protein